VEADTGATAQMDLRLALHGSEEEGELFHGGALRGVPVPAPVEYISNVVGTILEA